MRPSRMDAEVLFSFSVDPSIKHLLCAVCGALLASTSISHNMWTMMMVSGMSSETDRQSVID